MNLFKMQCGGRESDRKPTLFEYNLTALTGCTCLHASSLKLGSSFFTDLLYPAQAKKARGLNVPNVSLKVRFIHAQASSHKW